MHVIIGGTGNIGGAAATALLEAGEEVTVVTRRPEKADGWRRRGAAAEVVDVLEVDALRRVLRAGTRALVVNPPADPSTDTDVVERSTAAALVAALDGSELEKVVACSTYGAQPGERIGDLSVLHELEQGLRTLDLPVTINRGAYYFTNLVPSLESARDDGIVPTMFPADLVLPMVDPADLGRAAADRLVEPPEPTHVRFVEGPERHSFADVAAAFGRALDREVRPEVVPPDRWAETFTNIGFSDPAARSYARMIEASTSAELELPTDPERGPTTLDDYVAALVA